MVGLITNNETKSTRIKIGFFRNISSDDMIEFSTSATSPVIRAIISPFRSSEKNGNASRNILLYI